MRAAAALAAALAVALFAPPATGEGLQASRLELQDGRDARLPLDLREVDSAAGGQTLRITIGTWSRWTARQLRDRGYLVVHLDTLDAPGFEYYVLLRSNGRRMLGVLFGVRAGRRDRRLRRVTVWRSDRRSVSVRLARHRIEFSPGRSAYDWYVQTLTTTDSCKLVCFDRAPDIGAAREGLPPSA